MQRVKLESSLPRQSRELRRILNIPNHSKHRVFREELTGLYRESKAKNTGTFLTELEAIVRDLL